MSATGSTLGGSFTEPVMIVTRAEWDDLNAELPRLRALLARAMRHIDPNGDQTALDLLRECEEAVR